MILVRSLAFVLLTFTSATAFAQVTEDSTGLPGDNFSLQGALELFKRASSVEEFEKLLNTESSNVNNLDLNDDGRIDYIKVIDRADRNVHAFILQVPVTETENQDIAVIGLERTGDATAQLQIVGDEDIFGEEVIVEPDDGDGTAKFTPVDGMWYEHGPAASDINDNSEAVIVNVWVWPVVRYVYAPFYTAWVSPWRWAYRPVWWSPWRPVSWAVWRPRHAGFAPHYVVVREHRVIRARQVYRPVRSASVVVHTRYSAPVGHYRATRTTTTIEGKHGRKVKVTKTKVRRRR